MSTYRSGRVLVALVALLAALMSPSPSPSAAVGDTTGPMVAAVGDSITAGFGVPDARRTYPQVLLDRRFGSDRSRSLVVGHPGQCLVAAGCGYPTPLSATWGPEVLDVVPAGSTVVLEIGTNDLGRGLSDQQIQDAYRALVATAAARGVRVLVGTIPPREASQWPSYWWWGPQRERTNSWIRATYAGSSVDFDGALSGSDGWMRPAAGSGDGVHPNAYGASDMAYTVPLSMLP